MATLYKARVPSGEEYEPLAQEILTRLRKAKAKIATSIASEWVRGDLMRWEGGTYHCELLGYLQFIYIEAIIPPPKSKPRYYYNKGPRDAWSALGGKAYTAQPIMRFKKGEN